MWIQFKRIFNIHLISVVTSPAAVLQTIWYQFMMEFDIHVIVWLQVRMQSYKPYDINSWRISIFMWSVWLQVWMQSYKPYDINSWRSSIYMWSLWLQIWMQSYKPCEVASWRSSIFNMQCYKSFWPTVYFTYKNEIKTRNLFVNYLFTGHTFNCLLWGFHPGCNLIWFFILIQIHACFMFYLYFNLC